eukprot:XP_011663657.1 PREDICTED: angiotensin-converting enzyme 2-like [Strongylocentrotus purpuratus]
MGTTFFQVAMGMNESGEDPAEESLKSALFERKSADRAKEFNDVIADFPAEVQRQLMFIRDIGVAALDKETVEEYNLIIKNLSGIYSTGKVCKPDNASSCLNLEPGLESIMASSKNWDERVWAWKGFRDAVGIPNKPLYAKYVQLVNQGARANGLESIMASSKNWDERVWAWKGFRDAVGIPNKPLYAKYVQLVNQGARANGFGDMWGNYWNKDRTHWWYLIPVVQCRCD